MKYRKPEPVPTPVLEIGGTHVAAALILASPAGGHDAVGGPVLDRSLRAAGERPAETTWSLHPESIARRHLHAQGTAREILDTLAEAANALGSGHDGRWGIALPGPFDYRNGIALYENVGKFDQLRGVDVRAGLAERLSRAPKHISFLNDADAFGLGEFAVGAAGASRRAACITLGTGVGSTFLADGVPVKSGPDVPPDGSCYLLDYRGKPLEETVSRRAIRRAYAAASDFAAMPGTSGGAVGTVPDVREIAGLSRDGDPIAARVLDGAFRAVGEAAGPYLQRFGAEVLIIGGSMAGSWDIVEPAVRVGLASASLELAAMPISRAERYDEAGMIGAAYWAGRAAASVEL